MARPKPWLKMWVEWIHDPKMLNLTLAEQGAWWRLLALAQECGADGDLVQGNGAPMSLDEIAICLHLTRRRARADFNSMVEKMQDPGRSGRSSLSWNSGILTITNFKVRQAQIPSDSKDAVRDRVRKHRLALVTEKPLPPLTTPNNTTLEEEGEGDIESNGGKSVTADTVCAAISQLYSENIGNIKPTLAEDIRDFCENYRGPVSWIKPAFSEALNRNKKSWHYVRTILEDWEEKGGPDADSRRGGQRGRQRSGTHRQDAGEGDKFSGFQAIESGPEEPGGNDD